jgi:ferredoxin
LIRVTVNTARCEGHSMCRDAAPDVFALDDDGVATVLLDPIPENLTGQAEAGARACPVMAISVDDA